jgi:hypothetical protein
MILLRVGHSVSARPLLEKMRLNPSYLSRSILGLAMIGLLLLSGCDKGELLLNKLPDTRISVSQINLVGVDRLRSEVTLHWYGTDEDGWVTGYELSMDGSTWSPVDVQDSTFSFELSLNSDTTDIDFYVRAVDDKGDVDDTPAYLKVPIRNSAPTARFDSIQALPDTAFIALTLVLDVDDIDGIDNLDSIYIKANNGNWYPLSPTTTVVTLLPVDPQATSAGNAKVYLGTNAILQGPQIDGYIPGADNVFYVKAIDIANSSSPVDTSSVVFVTRQSSDLLVIDANSGSGNPSPEQVIYPALANTVGAFDVIDLRSNGGLNVPRLWKPTFELTLKTYQQVFWYGDASDIALALLEDAAGAIQSYLSSGGKMLINTSFPTTYDNTSVIQEFTPVDSISTSSGTVRLPTDSLLVPDAVNATGYDSLQTSVFIGRATPFYVKSSAQAMYTGNLFTSGGWVGPNTVAARLVNGAGKTTVVFLSVQIHQVNGRPIALENFLNQVLLNEFNW